MTNDFHEVVERPVDIFYGSVVNYIIISFKNRSEIDAVAETESFITFLRDLWHNFFSEIDDVLDFVRHCTYHACLIGRFYRMNCFLPLDHVFYFLKESNRLPNPNSSFRTWNILHKLARLILIEYCSEYSSNISLNLDVHVKNGRGCDASDSAASYLNLEGLPDEQDCVLVFHVTIIYNDNTKLFLTSSETSSNITSNYNDCKNNLCEKAEISKIPKCVSSQISDSTSESPKDSTDNASYQEDNQWEKYGAKPKTRFMQKNYSDSSEIQKRNENADMPLKSYRKEKHSATSEKVTLSQNQSNFLKEFEKMESSLQDATCQKFQDLSLLPCSSSIKKISPERSFSNEPTNTNNSTLQRPVESLPSSSGVINQTDSVCDNTRFRNFVNECLSSKQWPNKYDQIVPDLSISQTSEDNRYPENCDERPRDIHHSQNPECNISENKDSKTQDFPGKGAITNIYTDTDKEAMFPYMSAVVFKRLLEARKELVNMSENVRQLQMMYEEEVSKVMKSEAIDDFSSDSKESMRVQQCSQNEQCTDGTQQDYFLQMPFIYFPPELTRQVVTSDDDNFYTFTTNIGFQVRESIFRHELKMFFDNYQFPEASSKEFTEKSMKSRADREYYNPYHSTDYKSNPSTIEYPKTSCETNVSNEYNQTQASISDDFNSGHLAIGTSNDKVSFNWDYFTEEKASNIDNLKATCFPETSRSTTSGNDKVFIVDGEPAASGSSDEQCDLFFQMLIQKLTETPPSFTQTILPPDCTGTTASPNKKHSSPEQIPKYCDDLNLVQSEKLEDDIKFDENSEDEMLYDVSEESLDLSDCESSCDDELASEFEQ